MKNQIILLLTIMCVLFSGNLIADDLPQEIRNQAQRSLVLLLQNISRPDSARGSVVAAPSKSEPDYFYHWIRDAALVIDSLVKVYERTSGFQKHDLKQTLNDFVTFSRRNQLTPNPSGGLGEPKFNMDGSAFTGDWGRPQNDGPALRALALTHYAQILLREGDAAYVRKFLYDGKIPTDSVIKADLEYVAHHWKDFNVDPWEETGGHHFYNVIVSRGALVQGARLAESLGDGGAADFYRQQANEISQALGRFWDADRKIFFETIGQTPGKIFSKSYRLSFAQKSGLDSAVILGILHADSGDGFLLPSHDGVLSTAYALITTFQNLYPINKNSTVAPAIGRYPEDVYNGTGTSEGSPWFLITTGFAELCYRVRLDYIHSGVVRVSNLNQGFLNFVLQGRATVQPGMSLPKGTKGFQQIVDSLGMMGDEFLKTVLLHKGADGSLSEQFNRHTGYLQGAPNLSWSHAAFITATLARSAR